MTACTCGKVRYESRRLARLSAREIRGRGGAKMRAYECGGFWHLTSQSTARTTWFRKAGAS